MLKFAVFCCDMDSNHAFSRKMLAVFKHEQGSQFWKKGRLVINNNDNSNSDIFKYNNVFRYNNHSNNDNSNTVTLVVLR